MKDFRKQELKIGDEVIYMDTSYKRLYIGFVCNIGEHKVTIMQDHGVKTSRYPHIVIKDFEVTN